jgi:hypothetical protein
MTWRRRPIPKRVYPGLAAAKGPSLRYELICNGAVRKYPDGREVCEDSLAGRREYLRRLELCSPARGTDVVSVASASMRSTTQHLNTSAGVAWAAPGATTE